MALVQVCEACGLRHHERLRKDCLVCGGKLVPVKDPRIGTVLAGRYLLEDVIGEGGMATVYRARHTLMERPYAVKVLHRNLVSDEKLVERMRREARSAATLTHPNIIEIYDFGMTEDGAPFLVMELLEGRSLRERLREGRIPLSELVDLGIQMARGLARAHDFGIIHRDLKPENVFLVDGDNGHPRVKLVDFGIARSRADPRLTNRGEVVGTPQYMAPERVTSSEVTSSADLYSLGVVLYEMATGVLPFESNHPTGFVLKHMHEAPRGARERDPSVPAALDALIMALLQKDPRDRPVDAHRILEVLQALIPRSSVPPEAPPRSGPSVQEHTSTLDGWVQRTSLFERMLDRAYPENAPRDALDRLAAIREAVGRMRSLREQGVRAQRELDELEEEVRGRGERLGHAVHVLAVDLSRAREEERLARLEAERREEARETAKGGYHEKLATLEALTEERPEHPGEGLVAASRSVADAAEAWERTDAAAERSRTRVERSRIEVEDLEYQVRELGAQLGKLESTMSEKGAASRELLERNGEDRRELEERLVELVDAFVGPLRQRRELGELFAALEGTGVTTARLATAP